MELDSPENDRGKKIVIGVVGPCAGGKSTLLKTLEEHDLFGKHIAQEHSYVADMWERISKPDILIFLDVSYKVSMERRKMNWSEKEYDQQVKRLVHARENANLYINTDDLSLFQVEALVLEFLQQYTRDNSINSV